MVNLSYVFQPDSHKSQYLDYKLDYSWMAFRLQIGLFLDGCHVPVGLGLADFILLPEGQASKEGGLLGLFQGLLQLLSNE